jgi:serine/threonine-protein kinase
VDKEIEAGASDRNLLFGVIALQMNFVDRDALLRAMNAWVLDKTEPIENILVSQGDLEEATKRLLVALVDRHLECHDLDPQQSLASLSSAGGVAAALNSIQDFDLQQSIVHLNSDFRDIDPQTISFVGDATNEGGRFRILRPHKKGGLGAVSVALDQELNREVALKEVQQQYSEHVDAQDRLRVEAEITGGLEHPGIVPVYGLGAYDDGRPFYCMRFIRGNSLKDAIRSFHDSKSSMDATAQNLELRNLLRRFIDVCDAIDYAHSRKVLHRDLKPGNIMLGKYGETLVVDWGLAKATASTRKPIPESTELPVVPRSGSTASPTMQGSAMGTLGYMSPEQADGHIDILGPATDIYSLGATLYCLLTGESPIQGADNSERMRRAISGKFASPREVDPSIPAALQAICLKAMQFRPVMRYESAGSLSSDVERWLADERVLAFDEPLLRRFGRFLRKNRTATTTIAFGSLVAFAGLIGMNLVSRAKNVEITEKNRQISMRSAELKESNDKLQLSQDALHGDFEVFSSMAFDLVQKAEGDLSQLPGAEKFREWISGKALEMIENYEGVNPDKKVFKDGKMSRVLLANLNRTHGNFLRNQSRYEDALKCNNEAVQLMRELLAENETDPVAQGNLSDFLQDLAITNFESGKTQQAKSDIAEAIELSGKMLEKYPTSAKVQNLHAVNCADGASLFKEIGDVEKSQEYFEEYFANVDVPENVEDSKYTIYLLALVGQSENYLHLEDFELAKKWGQRALVEASAALEKSTARRIRHAVARSNLQLVKIANASDSAEEAIADNAIAAIEIWTKLNKDHPDFVHYKRYLVRMRSANGKLLQLLGRIEPARDAFNASNQLASELRDADESQLNLVLLFETLVQQANFELEDGEQEAAVRIMEQATQIFDLLGVEEESSTIEVELVELFRKLSLQLNQ